VLRKAGGRHTLLVASALVLALAASPVLAQIGGGGSGGASAGAGSGSLGSTPRASGGAARVGRRPDNRLGAGGTAGTGGADSLGGTAVETGSPLGIGTNLGTSNAGSAATGTPGGGAATSGSSSPPSSVTGSTLTDSTRTGLNGAATPRTSPGYLNNGLDTMNGSTRRGTPDAAGAPGANTPGRTTGR
jgi:hypothetical protein